MEKHVLKGGKGFLDKVYLIYRLLYSSLRYDKGLKPYPNRIYPFLTSHCLLILVLGPRDRLRNEMLHLGSLS